MKKHFFSNWWLYHFLIPSRSKSYIKTYHVLILLHNQENVFGILHTRLFVSWARIHFLLEKLNDMPGHFESLACEVSPDKSYSSYSGSFYEGHRDVKFFRNIGYK